MENNMFRVGVLGAGHIALKMAQTLSRMEGVEPYAVAARNLAKAEDFAAANGFTKAYGSYEELAADPQVDLIYVATPHSLHYGHVRLCLEHGRNVLCEKSFMMDARQAADVVALAREKGIFLAEAIWTRYMPMSRTIADLVRSGAVGRPAMLVASLGYPVAGKERIVRPELGGGALLDLGVYGINFMLMCFGHAVAETSSFCVPGPTGVDLQHSISFRYEDGKMAVVHSSVLCANDRQGVISGDRGYLVVDNINNPMRADLYDTEHRLVRSYLAPEQITGFEYQVASCMKAIREGRTEPEEMPHSESVLVMEMMDGIRRQWNLQPCGQNFQLADIPM